MKVKRNKNQKFLNIKNENDKAEYKRAQNIVSKKITKV